MVEEKVTRRRTRFKGHTRQTTAQAEAFAARLERQGKEAKQNLLVFVIGDRAGITVESVLRRKKDASDTPGKSAPVRTTHKRPGEVRPGRKQVARSRQLHRR